MARISLRAYNREIENLIDRGQIEEAIAHCKNILKQFPKHMDTYRLLGKALLESQRYAEAADILLRILSVFPDDFVSQLGMSIIREDEGNLDAAIWHMERAYEVQPFNRAVQDELRRLYGRRDGIEPPRIRLTRGALVRMYARGDLYPQAIAEIRSALQEDPTRIDLQILLARMYYLSGQKIEATEICSSVIDKLPYCYEANKILMEVLPETSRADDARVFQQRIFSLDPYAAFISPNAPTSAQVPEQTVMVEKIEWQPSMAEEESPGWARTIGVSWDESPQENLPDWLNSLSPETPLSPPVEEVNLPSLTQKPEEEIIPDFLKEAGWNITEENVVETPPESIEEATPERHPEEDEIFQAEIPDWLKELAPESAEQIAPSSEEATPGDLDWLSQILPTAEETPGSPTQEVNESLPSFEGTASSEALPPIQKEPISPEAEVFPWQEPASFTEPSSELPFEEEVSLASAFSENEHLITEDIESIATSPEALSPVDRSAPSQPEIPTPIESSPAEDESVPDWIRELTAADETTGPSIPPEIPSPSASETTAGQILNESPVSPIPEEKDLDSALAWLEALAARQGADQESLTLSSPETRTETPPEWILQQPEAESETLSSSENIPESTGEISGEPVRPMSSEDTEQALAWLEALAARQGADEETLTISQPEERTEIPPSWVQQTPDETIKEAFEAPFTPPFDEALEEKTDIQTSPALEDTQPASVQRSSDKVEEAIPEIPDAESALAWLESLAARQGADAETLITHPEQRSEVPPEWVLEAQKASENQLELEPLHVEEAEPAAEKGELVTGEEPMPSTEEVSQPETEESLYSESSEIELPEWLRSYEEEQQIQEPVWVPDESFQPESLPEEALPAWLLHEEEQATHPPEPPAVVAPETNDSASELPEWLKALQEPPPLPKEEIPPSITPSEWIPETQSASISTDAGTPMQYVEPGTGPYAQAQLALRSGDLPRAVEIYTQLINAGARLDDIIADLRTALAEYPDEVILWQTLGDACIRNNRIQDALDAYTRAEELLR
ncbi:cytochrome c biogenesis factor [Anaerolinea thermolimosa]|uniref:tetratricopeptide repeat protein n=1 Tax=Anaerolinea thermolimosa TaxID=229919 RepID=UPI000782C5BF|nr:tetratricopeptide repeat protein [Anaerolinea thermolimosa]GAP06682.1 cytochrome c biogenesis factor [Anaerolinea thermolimosa]